MSEEYLLGRMSWPKVQEALKKSDIAIVPVGSTEQHGRHMPVDNDHYVAFQMAKAVAERLKGKVSVVVCPAIPYGISPHHMGFPGTVTVQTATFIAMMKDISRSLVEHGFRKILFVNGHGGNTAALQTVVSDMRVETGAYFYQTDWWHLGADIIVKICSPPVFHAEETETSVSMAMGQTVELSEARDSMIKTESSFINYDVCAPPPQISGALPLMKEMTENGTIGYASRASREKGVKIMDTVTERICQFLVEISKTK